MRKLFVFIMAAMVAALTGCVHQDQSTAGASREDDTNNIVLPERGGRALGGTGPAGSTVGGTGSAPER